MVVKCEDGGPARNHWFMTMAESKVLSKTGDFKSTGFHSVCNPRIKTYQLKDGDRVGPSYVLTPKR